MSGNPKNLFESRSGTRQLNDLIEKARPTPTVMRSAPSVLPRKVIKLSRSRITELG
jgi:hypothetical protein